jgi:hypothetical protein
MGCLVYGRRVRVEPGAAACGESPAARSAGALPMRKRVHSSSRLAAYLGELEAGEAEVIGYDYWVTDGLYGSMNSVLYDHATLAARWAPRPWGRCFCCGAHVWVAGPGVVVVLLVCWLRALLAVFVPRLVQNISDCAPNALLAVWLAVAGHVTLHSCVTLPQPCLDLQAPDGRRSPRPSRYLFLHRVWAHL